MKLLHLIVAYIAISLAYGSYTQIKLLRRDLKEREEGVYRNNRTATPRAMYQVCVIMILATPFIMPFSLIVLLTMKLYPLYEFIKPKEMKLSHKDMEAEVNLSEDRSDLINTIRRYKETLGEIGYRDRARSIQEILLKAPQDCNAQTISLIEQTCNSIRKFTGWHKYSEMSDDVVYDHANDRKVAESMAKLGATGDMLAMQFLIVMTLYNSRKGGSCDALIKHGIEALGSRNHRDVRRHLDYLAEHSGDYDIMSVAKRVRAEIGTKKKWKL